MRSKEEIAIYWIIACIGILLLVAIEPAIIFYALFAYSIYSLYNHYSNKRMQ